MMAKATQKQDISSFRDMDAAKLGDEMLRLKKEQFNLRFQQATGQLEKPSRIRDVRRAIARVQTALREKAPKAKV
jgi:large subunit ribosomal protein L29